MAWNNFLEDSTTFGLVPKAMAGVIKTPLFNLNNSGYQAPTMNASGFTPTLGMGATKPIVKPSTTVTTKPKGLAGTAPKSKVQSTKKTSKPDYSGMPQPLPALGSTAQAVTPMVAQDTMSSIGIDGGVTARMPYEVGGSDMFADTNSYLDNRGMTGEVVLPEGQYTNLAGEGTVGLGGTTVNSNWVDGMSNFETLQGAAGLGGLAMNAYGMFGSGGTMDVNKKNIQLMDQQIVNNKELMATRQARGRDISAAFGPKTGLGA